MHCGNFVISFCGNRVSSLGPPRIALHRLAGVQQDLPVQSAVSSAEVEEMARGAENALQATVEQSAWDVACLTHETRTTFEQVEATMLGMDSHVESLDDRLFHL